MSSSRRIVFGTLALGGLAALVTAAAGQNPNNPKGIDVSNIGQGNISLASWQQIKNSGISFAVCKATEGTTFKDPSFDANWANMKAVGIVRGAYHFARPGTSPSIATNAVNQANFFVKTVLPKQGDLQMALDLEATGGLTQAQLWTWVQAFCGQVQSLTHRPGLIYCSPSFWSSNLPGNATNLNCGLWIANWGVSSPTIPAPWASTGYAFWQYADNGTVPGISGAVDLDTFNGSMTTLLKFTFPREPLQRK
ncbi:MAG TPA: GH25 family lysozyme [Gemmataceae bacterium]|jgi:GH25 family lysozyme M1 (1,4-beta-N-acetylmuramidase)